MRLIDKIINMDLMLKGFWAMIIFMIIGFIVGAFDILIGQSLGMIGFTIMVITMIITLKRVQPYFT